MNQTERIKYANYLRQVAANLTKMANAIEVATDPKPKRVFSDKAPSDDLDDTGYPKGSFKVLWNDDKGKKVYGIRLDNPEHDLYPGDCVSVARKDGSTNLYLIGELVTESSGGKYGGAVYAIDRQIRKGEKPPPVPSHTERPEAEEGDADQESDIPF